MARPRVALQPEMIPKQEVYLELVRAHEQLTGEVNRFFQSHNITAQQFNVLRILYVRDDGAGLPCSAIGGMLLNRVPDITRLLDRLERAGYVSRGRCSTDRRIVRAQLTDAGHDLVEAVYKPTLALHDQMAGHLTDGELLQLIALLQKLRHREE